MTKDIIERLDDAVPYGLEDYTLLVDAAAEIERLRAAGDALVKAVGGLSVDRVAVVAAVVDVVAAMQDWNKTRNTKEES